MTIQLNYYCLFFIIKITGMHKCFSRDEMLRTYPNYVVTPIGGVYVGDIKMKQSTNNSGYKYVFLYRHGVRKMFYVHRLVAFYYLRKPKWKHFINHVDGDKTNNAAVNLQWCNASENQLHAFKNGLNSTSGTKNGNSRFTEQDVIDIRKRSSYGMSNRQIATIYSVHNTTIMKIVNNISYRK